MANVLESSCLYNRHDDDEDDDDDDDDDNDTLLSDRV